MLYRRTGNYLAGLEEQPVTQVISNVMRDAEPSGKPTSASIDLDLLLVVIPHTVVELEVEPF
jgi:hypothetical protein